MRVPVSALAVAAMLVTTVTLAQQPSPTPGQQMQGPMMGQGMMERGMMMGQMMRPGMMPMMEMDPAQHIDGRLAFLRTELKITDAQMPQWNAFADAWRANARRMSDLMGAMMSGSMMGAGMSGSGTTRGPEAMSGQASAGMGLPDRLERAEQQMTAHLEMIRAMKTPTSQLYGVLSDEQKRLADQLIHGPMGMGMM